MYRSTQFAIVTVAIALFAMTANAGVGDYGVHWSTVLEDDTTEVSENRFNTHGGVVTPNGYVDTAWIHQGGTTVWGGTSPTGQFSAVAGLHDAWGRNTWTDFSSDTGSGQQSYLRSIAYDPVNNRVAIGGYNRNDLENPGDTNVVHNYYVRVIDVATGNQVVNKSFTQADGSSPWNRASHFDSSGTLFTAGYARSDIAGLTYTGTNIPAGTNNDFDPVLLKHNADGSVAMGIFPHLSDSSDIAHVIQTDGSGNIYLITNSNGTTAGGGLGDYDIVVQKYNSSMVVDGTFNGGLPLHLGDTGFDWATHADFHPTTGELIIVGSTGTSGVEEDLYVASLNPTTGAVNWSDRRDSSDNQEELGSGLSFDEDGDIWVGGSTDGDLFGTNVSDKTALDLLNNVEQGDFFAAEYSSTGTFKQGIQWGTAGDDRSGSVKLDGTEQIMYVNGGIIGRDSNDADPNDSPEFTWMGANVHPGQGRNNTWQVTQRFIAGDQDGDGYITVADVDDVMNNLFANTPAYDGDFDRDSDFDQDDADRYIQVLLATNYGDNDLDGDVDTVDLTNAISNFNGAGGTGKNWSDGNTNGDGDVDTVDLTETIGNFTGALSAPTADGALDPNVPDLIYNPNTGVVSIDTEGQDVISFSMQGGPFNTGNTDFSGLPAGLSDNIANQIGWTSFNIGGGLVGSADLGAILPAGLSEAQFLAALAGGANYGLSVVTGGGGPLDLIYLPEPASLMLMGLGAMALVRRRRAA